MPKKLQDLQVQDIDGSADRQSELFAILRMLAFARDRARAIGSGDGAELIQSAIDRLSGETRPSRHH